MTPLDTDKIVSLAGDSLVRLYYKSETSSTNDDALELAKAGAEPGTVILAESQTQGRGRRGAVWMSPPGTSLTFSYLTSHEYISGASLYPSLLAGLSCVRALKQLGISVLVKWPNDLYLNGKKLAGILTEMTGSYLVIGIGINVNVSSFPSELQDIATSLSIEIGAPVSREKILAELIKSLHQTLHSSASHIDGLRECCALTGRAVTLTTSGRRIEGHVRGLGDEGELLLWTGRSTLVLNQADEIRFA